MSRSAWRGSRPSEAGARAAASRVRAAAACRVGARSASVVASLLRLGLHGACCRHRDHHPVAGL